MVREFNAIKHYKGVKANLGVNLQPLDTQTQDLPTKMYIHQESMPLL